MAYTEIAEDTEFTEKSGNAKLEKRNPKSGRGGKTQRFCHDPSTTRPDAPEVSAKKKSGRFGRDDNWCAGAGRRERRRGIHRAKTARWGRVPHFADSVRNDGDVGEVRWLEEEVLEEAREEEDDEEGGDAKEGAEGELVLGGDGETDGVGVAFAKAAAGGARSEIAFPATGVENEDGSDADDAAQEGAEENGEKGSAEAEKGADHGHHFDVAHTHAITFADEFVNDGGGQEEQAAESGAEERVNDSSDAVGESVGQAEPEAIDAQERTGENARGKGQAEAQAEEVDGVREETDEEVGDNKNDEEAAEEEPFEGGQGDAEGVVGEDEVGAGEELDDGVHGRDGEAAVAAFAAEEEPTEDGDVVVGLDGCLAARAAGGGANDGESFGDARDANVEEAADDDAEEEEEKGNHQE